MSDLTRWTQRKHEKTGDSYMTPEEHGCWTNYSEADEKIERLKEALRVRGGCRMLSEGDKCDCGLCKRDNEIARLQEIERFASHAGILKAQEDHNRMMSEMAAKIERLEADIAKHHEDYQTQNDEIVRCHAKIKLLTLAEACAKAAIECVQVTGVPYAILRPALRWEEVAEKTDEEIAQGLNERSQSDT